jgi:hypothetical protein
MSLCRVVVAAMFCVALVTPARAETLATAGKQIIVGIVVVSAAVAVGVTLLVIHYKHKKSSITGCVTSAANAMSLTDEKDQRTYALSGDTAAIKPGDRMTLLGKQLKRKDAAFVFESQKVGRDFGACKP